MIIFIKTGWCIYIVGYHCIYLIKKFIGSSFFAERRSKLELVMVCKSTSLKGISLAFNYTSMAFIIPRMCNLCNIIYKGSEHVCNL